MRLIDSDALMENMHVVRSCTTNRGMPDFDRAMGMIDRAPTICCERCAAMVDRDDGYRPAMCGFCYCGSKFEEASDDR